MTTAVVDIGSDLERRRWMREGLVQAASKSFWGAYTGMSKDSVVFQANNENSGSGHTVVFDFDGNLSGKAVKGKDTAFGKGEQKKKFSDKMTVERYRLVADNGDKFDGVNIGDLSINEHSDSRNKLGDLFIRFKDQMLFDAASGVVNTESKAVQAPTHIIDLGTTFTYNTLLDISTTLKTSTGFSTGTRRAPLKPFTLQNGEPCWIMMVDAAMANVLRQDSNYQTVIYNADVRGNNNRLLSGVIGKIGNLILVEAPNFFGSTSGTTPGFGFNDTEIEISGLRQYQGATPATALWSGQVGFDYEATTLHSRGFILGAGALQIAFGKQPDYKWKGSQDFDIKSESAVEFWSDACKTKLKAENADYKQAKIAEVDYGLIAVDLQIGA